MDNFVFKKDKNFRNFILATSLYGGAYIFGPLILLGGSGYLLDLYFKTKPIITFSFVFIAFVFTNILFFRKAMAISREISNLGGQTIKKDETEEK